jgi:hypothetical protein
MKKRSALDAKHRERLEQAAHGLPAHLHKVGVPALQSWDLRKADDPIIEAVCSIYKIDPDNARGLLGAILAKAHAEAKKARTRSTRQISAARRFEDELKPRIKEFEMALEPARKIVAGGDWERLQSALIQCPGALRDMNLPELESGAKALLEIFANIRIALRTRDARIATARGRPAEVYPKAAIETLAREWMQTFPNTRLKSVSIFPKSPRAASGVFALFAKEAWRDLAFEPNELTVERLNDAIATVGENRSKNS